MASVNITTGGGDYVERASDVMAEIFVDDPALRFMTSSLPEPERLTYLRKYMNILFVAAQLNSGIFQEANDWSSVAVWMPPGKAVDNTLTLIPAGFVGCIATLGLGSVKVSVSRSEDGTSSSDTEAGRPQRMLLDFGAHADALKKKGMPGVKKFHYLFFMGTQSRVRGQGLASKIITEFQPRAAQDNLPIWLEATTAHSRDIYARCGFELVGEFVMGKGTHDAKGFKQKGGDGVRMYGMVWFPETKNP